LLKAERGDSGESVVKATDELMRKAADIVKASDGKTPIDAAVKSVLSTDTELRDRVNAEREGKE
jgi:propanediol dehydratase small subunit